MRQTNVDQRAAERIASESYDPSDNQSKNPVSRGLATTHEQVADDYMEGTNDGHIDQYAGEDNVEIPRKGYQGMFKS
ncbi:YozQ family protein [Brevibacillus humidisoli]|uniref:YozQ family protein n=1 Tax=Brevibacillus humidisoli TaxID=2895522 RepID=UPI001E58C5C5|nr:YozQ family protein [Brevibacillus humidisoli]UFJ41378.1 YozQ family protein [Brevibacillus humidisoli]